MIELTIPTKHALSVHNPVLLGPGAAGYDGGPYRNLISLDHFGALFTSPVSLSARFPAHGARVVPMPGGFLLHTGLPNAGIRKVLQEYEPRWARSPLPVILHVLAESPQDMEQIARNADRCRPLAGLEISLGDQLTMRETRDLLIAAKQNTDLPLFARLPLYNAHILSDVAQQNEAAALVVAAPPRGTERSPAAGRLIGGRVYGWWLKAQVLRVLGRVVQYSSLPVIAAGGVHSLADVQDFLAAGARAVQVDTLLWRDPLQAEALARAYSEGLTNTAQAVGGDFPTGSQPRSLPELPAEEDATHEAGPRDN
jgi:dihydroorotate dehydrogenase (NAD+) catalytic subunit